MRILLFSVLLGVSMGFAPEVLAQAKKNPTMQADMSAKADEQFRLGREEANRGDCQKALVYFRESHALKPGRGTLLNMGLCEKKLGQLAKALQHFEELLPQLPQGDDRRTIVREALADIKQRVPWVRIVLSANAPAGTVVSYDDAELEPTMIGTDIPVDPGKHVVVVEAPGIPNRRYDIVMEEGKRVIVQVEPGGAAASTTAPAAADDSARKNKLTAGFVVGGIGIAGLLGGAITGGIAIKDHSSTEAACPTHKGCSNDVVQLASTGQTMSTVSTIAFAVGVVGVGIGLPLVLLNRKSETPPPTMGVIVTPYGASIGLSGVF